MPPATGPELLLETSSVHAPEGWKLEDPLAAYQAGASNPTGLGTVSLLDTQGLDVDDTLDDIYRAVRQGLPPGAKPTRQPDIVLGEEQQPAVFFSYTVPDSDLSFSQVVTSRQGRTVSINFSLEPGDLAKDPDLVASVIASFEWV